MSDINEEIRALGAFAHDLSWEDVSTEVQRRASLVLLDTLGVTIAGARTPELLALRDSWSPGVGRVSVIGGGFCASAHDAMWLNGIAACCLEMDEGNKFAQGHPAAHVLFAVLAEAQTRPCAGSDLMSAFLIGHEVASRFGRSMLRRTGLHTHGHWGALGAAAAVARLRGGSASAIAGAIDAAGGLALATPWESALRGSFVRNTWIGAANVAGTVAASLSLGDLASVDGTVELTLGGLLGELQPGVLTEDLGTRFDVCLGYFKRHSSCSYTHPPIDAVLEFRSEGLTEPDKISEVLVETNSLAAPLTRTELPTRLAAMFSIPYVIAVALTEGAVQPASFDGRHRTDARLQRLMQKVAVRQTDEIDRRLPAERVAKVTVTMDDGRKFHREVPNPIGDADHHPLERPEIVDKLERLLDRESVRALVVTVDELGNCDDVTGLLAQLV